MKTTPLWDEEGCDWPNRRASRFVRAAGLEWHVQLFGSGPKLLLIHGTGAATHSWRDLAPLLGKHFSVLALDLPGHGFTELPKDGQYSLPKMSAALAQLLSVLSFQPAYIVGHSAGAAIALRLELDRSVSPSLIFSINGALMPFPGVAAIAFPALARLLFLNRFAAPFLARRMNDNDAIARLIGSTGSSIGVRGVDLYGRLFRTERHMAATVGMMANWDLLSLRRALKKVRTPLILIAADNDKTISPQVARATNAIVSGSTIISVSGFGHLVHEEAPHTVADIICKRAFARC